MGKREIGRFFSPHTEPKAKKIRTDFESTLFIALKKDVLILFTSETNTVTPRDNGSKSNRNPLTTNMMSVFNFLVFASKDERENKA